MAEVWLARPGRHARLREDRRHQARPGPSSPIATTRAALLPSTRAAPWSPRSSTPTSPRSTRSDSSMARTSFVMEYGRRRRPAPADRGRRIARRTMVPLPDALYIMTPRLRGAALTRTRSTDLEGHPLHIIHRDVFAVERAAQPRRRGSRSVTFGVAKGAPAHRRGHPRAAWSRGKFSYMSPEAVPEQAGRSSQRRVLDRRPALRADDAVKAVSGAAQRVRAAPAGGRRADSRRRRRASRAIRRASLGAHRAERRWRRDPRDIATSRRRRLQLALEEFAREPQAGDGRRPASPGPASAR